MRTHLVKEPNRRHMFIRLSIMAVLALGIAGCSRGNPETEQNVAATEPAGTTVEIPETVAPPVIPSEPAAPLENATVEEQLSEEQQIQEDADATGMTSRLPAPGAEPAPAVTE